MIKLYTTLLIGAVLTSCGTQLNYIGNTYSPTNNVDVYVDESAIKKKFEIVGKGYVRTTPFSKAETVQSKAITKARQKGADAVLIKDYYIPISSATDGVFVRDTVGKAIVHKGSTSMIQPVGSEFMVLFLKYN